MTRLRPLWFIPSLTLMVAMLLTACGGLTTPATQATAVSIVTLAPATSAPPTAEPADLQPIASSTPTPRPAATATAPPAMTPPDCNTGKAWSQTRAGMTLAMCFDPYPPQLGSPATYEALITDAAGQPFADATVELTLVGGMAGMEGEHDEDFSVQLDSQGSGWYTVQATVGPADLVLTEVRIEVLSGGQSWSFSASVNELSAP